MPKHPLSGVFLFEKIKSPPVLLLNIYMENKHLTVADMASLKAIIEMAHARGTFKPEELSTVGLLYDKLTDFVAQSQAHLQQQAEIAAQNEKNLQQAQGEQNA